MKAKLEFDLPEEQEEHLDAINGSEYKDRLRKVDNRLRNWIKHNGEAMPIEGLEEIREMCGYGLWD